MSYKLTGQWNKDESTFHFTVHRGDKPLLFIFGEYPYEEDFSILYIIGISNYADETEEVGVKAVREALRLLKKRFPRVETIYGRRGFQSPMTGARQSPEEVIVNVNDL